MLTICDLSLRLAGKQILDRVSFSLRPQRITALVGKNGSGKSSILSCINRQLPYSGQIMEGEKNFARMPAGERAKTVAILPQNIPAPHIPAEEMVGFGRTPYLDVTGKLREADYAAVREALQDAHAEAFADRYVDTLSGGERQRIALAMILAQNTPIVLLDEPTAHMDQGYEALFLQALTELKQSKKKTFLVVLHDLTAAIRCADDFLVLDAGKLIFSGSKEELLRGRILEDTFGLRRYIAEGTGESRFFFASE